MKTPNYPRTVLTPGRLFLTSSSLAILVAGSAHAQQVINDGDDATVTSAADGEAISAAAGVTSTVDGAPVVVVANNDVTLDNAGTLATTGVTQTVQVNQGTAGATINNAVTGRLEADSRVVNFDGTDATLNNDGVILGTGSQRNGAVYGNRTSNNITINNSATGSIDAGVEGAGIAIEVGGGGAPRGGSITNAGTIQGRGQASPMGGTAGDGIRFFGPGLAPEYIYEGDITNSGLINSESTQGTVAGIRFANRIGFQGTLNNTSSGTISGAQNGLYFGNDADHTGGVVLNSGVISSDSRALNIDGTGLVVNNLTGGRIIGSGSQRNGTVYADSTAQDFVLNNAGTIDAGMANQGAGFSVELSEEGNNFTILNSGTIQGRGQAGAGAATAGDGLRFERTRVTGMLDGSTTGLFTGDIVNSGLINSESTQGTTAGIRFVNGTSFQGTLTNDVTGVISGAQNGLYFGNLTPAGGGDHTGSVVNNLGTISSDSRALNLDGIGLVINNSGSILGTGNQRNGTVYADSTAQNFELNNFEDGVIDAGEGNEGAGFSAELSEDGNDFSITNAGTIQGRGQAGAGAATAGDGLRFERTRVAGMLDGSTTGLFTGDIINSGTISSESAQGTAAGIRFVNGVSFQGTLTNEEGGIIEGVQNGLYFGNAVPAGGADHTGSVVNNAGIISSDSRALNIDGTGLVVNNLTTGQIIGTGNQRNGTVYADSTAQDFTFNNAGIVDAGEGNEGSGFGAETAPDGNTFDLVNSGAIQGRGQASAATNGAGDGVRIGNVGNVGVFDGTIVNSGLINSESTQGTTAGIRFVNGIGLQGTLTNEAGGVISGAQNGLYFGNPVAGQGADHTGGVVNNAGTISSDSRALNIDGIGLVVNNSGSIIGTGNQRNGTVYADSTAQNFELNNLEGGLIDAGEGNEGAGFSVELASAADGGNTFDITNAGTIQGRGTAAAGVPGAGDGLRFERTRNMGALDGTSDGLFVGNITNSGTIDSEGDSGTTAGIRFVNGVSFQGVLDNSGTISGVQNGLYFGNPTPAGGGDFTGAVVNNSGVISSGSRALNIDGNGLTVNNSGSILGTGAQRNGTVYADGTANNFTFNNTGVVDADVAGSAVSLQLGTGDGDLRSFTIVNDGTLAGRGEAQASGASAGLRLFNGAGAGTTVTADQDIVNTGTISAETGAAVSIENVAFTGTFTNSGTITGPVAVDASTALAALNFVQNGGSLEGNFIGSAFADTLAFGEGTATLSGDILGGVDVTTDAASSITVSGARSIEGNLTVGGTLGFDLGVDSLAVDGDTVLGAGSAVNVATAQIGQADIGSTIDVLTETGTFTNNGTAVNVIEDDFLIDYTVNLGSISITAAAANLAGVSGDANVNSFGGAITSAAANNRLSAPVFAALNGVTSATDFEAAALTLLPAINDGVTREIFEAQRLASAQVQDRLSGNGVGLWGEAFYRTADADPTSLSSLGYDADTLGFTLGLDGKVGENTTVGVLFNYSDIEVEAGGLAGAESEIDAIQIGAYAGFDLGQAYVNAELGYSTSSVDNSRTALGSPITGESDVDGVYGSLNVGYNIETGGVVITPNGGLRYAELSRDTFTENGGLGLTLDSDSADFLEARLGLKVAGKAETGVIPFASVDYAYDLSSDPLAVNGSFNGGADTFTVIADEAGDSRFDIAAGVDFVNEGGLSIGAEYRGRFASDYQSHSGGVRIRFAF